ncbi:HAMP domain-containing sensor histidine kinase [Dehalobacter sp.]|uniref:sensor histidine kinase n=1 Tax=Dehalobacter sp. TaxID=1962289 RepID=UPI00258A514E|nr:HAMP domain-containing sensor histidine kinase [Dehalobacter sp.]MDJ0307071.1 HAMP domain-containing sensor histidine kinase [Dehalobacter sp.]
MLNKLREYFNKSISLQITLIYNLVILCTVIVIYFLIPFIFNYAPGSINTDFDIKVSYISYMAQFSIITILILVPSFVFLKKTLSDIDEWAILLNDDSPDSQNKLLKIRKKCLNLPYIIYMGQIVVSMLVIILILVFIGSHPAVMIYKILILSFSFATLAALFSFIFAKRIFTKILLNTSRYNELQGIKLSVRGKILLHVLPTIILAILFTSLVGYSRLITEKGDLIFDVYKDQLQQYEVSSIYDEAKAREVLSHIKLLNEKTDSRFMITPSGKYISLDNMDASDFFIQYAIDVSDKYGGRIFEGYGLDSQGASIKVNGQDGSYILGIKYDISSNNTVLYFIISFIALFILNFIVLNYFSRSLGEDVSRVAKNLSDISHGVNVDLDQKLAITSNDEIGDLIIAFNKIQEKEKANIESMKENQAIILEQERLASLGQLIGGIAHNLKTPIMSIAGGIEALKDLTNEYKESIEDQAVSPADHYEIAKEMQEWLDKMKPYCSYMTDIISAVKGQAVQMNYAGSDKFTVEDLVKRIDVLMKHELKKYHCKLKPDFQIDLQTEIRGELNSLVQVFDNLIINAMHAYEGQTGEIGFSIYKERHNLKFALSDHGKGIPEEVQKRLFKEMFTTKGKNGTGLGLYMSYSTIKGRFSGNMKFESQEGVGTTFYITIPYLSAHVQEANDETFN